jgi:hypothetical protein
MISSLKESSLYSAYAERLDNNDAIIKKIIIISSKLVNKEQKHTNLKLLI